MKCKEYIVKEGDTLFALARKSGSTVEEILELNRGIEPTRLVVGSIICLPRGGAVIQNPDEDLPMGVMPPLTNMQQYVVKEGDTMYSIARQNGISIEQLLFANPDVNPGYIMAGSTLNIPRADVPIPGSVQYVVKDDEDLIDILRKFNIGYGRLKLFNPDVDITDLEEGMIIFVPELYGSMPGKCDIGSYSYTVERGDTIESIADKFDVPERVIRKKGELKVGDVICIPLINFDDLM